MRLEVVRLLEIENQRLRDTIRDLRAQLQENWTAPRVMGLSLSEEILLGALVARSRATTEKLFERLYGPHETEREMNTIRVLMLRLRRKLKPHGVTITSTRGSSGGYWLDPESRARIEALLEAERCPTS